MAQELRIFFTALMFFTRLPCPKWVDHDPVYLNKASRYFSLVGLIVGVIGAGVYALASIVLPLPAAVMLSMVATVLTTGAFHEDGFADVCDGFGGGWNKEQILTIMKDSRVGAFGVLGLVLLFALRAALLLGLSGLMPLPMVFVAMVCAHTVSRAVAASLIFTHAYVQEDALSKSKPLAQRMGKIELFLLLFFGLLPLAFFAKPLVLLTVPPLLLARWWMGRWFVRWIGGYTGDCLGALQQVCDIVFLLSLNVLWSFI
jgi:adenosylcobinamide-GDP ribazoletransferase